MKTTSAISSLFDALSGIRFDPAEKPSRGENLTDLLEILAVAADVKPTHLNGQGYRSQAALEALDALVRSHGLLTLWTKSIRPYEHRKPVYDEAIDRWQKEKGKRTRLQGPDVLWVYKAPALEPVIQATVNGDIDVGEALGYPECCTRHDRESGLCLRERFIEKLTQTYRPQNPDEYIRLLQRDAKVRVDLSDLAIGHFDESTRLFPYVQFEACPQCLKTPDSPAARINRAMRNLAFSVSESFGRAIWKAQYEEIRHGLVKALDRHVPCPCGGNQTYADCCMAES